MAKQNLGQLADSIYSKNEQIAKANAAVKILEDEKKALEETILSALDEAGTDIARGTNATVSISKSIVPQIVDMDKLFAYVLRHKALQLFERRISATAYRELREQSNKPISGLIDFEKVRLNVRKL